MKPADQALLVFALQFKELAWKFQMQKLERLLLSSLWGRFFRAAQGRVLARSDSTVALALLGT